jgi:uncharacterized protein (TIGR02001 family)
VRGCDDSAVARFRGIAQESETPRNSQRCHSLSGAERVRRGRDDLFLDNAGFCVSRSGIDVPATSERASGLPWLLTALAALCTLHAPSVLAQGRSPSLEAYLTVSNDYRRHGLSQLDAGVSWQVGFDYEHASGLFAGAFAANVGYAADDRRDDRREHVLDAYVGYAWGRRKWQLNGTIGRYTYPGFEYGFDYTELGFGVTYADRFTYTATFAPDLYSADYAAWYHEIGFAQPLPGGWEFSGAIGVADIEVFAGGGYTFWNAGVSKIRRRVGLDLRYYGASLDRASTLGSADGDRVVLSVSYAFPRGN